MATVTLGGCIRRRYRGGGSAVERMKPDWSIGPIRAEFSVTPEAFPSRPHETNTVVCWRLAAARDTLHHTQFLLTTGLSHCRYSLKSRSSRRHMGRWAKLRLSRSRLEWISTPIYNWQLTGADNGETILTVSISPFGRAPWLRWELQYPVELIPLYGLADDETAVNKAIETMLPAAIEVTDYSHEI